MAITFRHQLTGGGALAAYAAGRGRAQERRRQQTLSLARDAQARRDRINMFRQRRLWDLDDAERRQAAQLAAETRRHQLRMVEMDRADELAGERAAEEREFRSGESERDRAFRLEERERERDFRFDMSEADREADLGRTSIDMWKDESDAIYGAIEDVLDSGVSRHPMSNSILQEMDTSVQRILADKNLEPVEKYQKVAEVRQDSLNKLRELSGSTPAAPPDKSTISRMKEARKSLQDRRMNEWREQVRNTPEGGAPPAQPSMDFTPDEIAAEMAAMDEYEMNVADRYRGGGEEPSGRPTSGPLGSTMTADQLKPAAPSAEEGSESGEPAKQAANDWKQFLGSQSATPSRSSTTTTTPSGARITTTPNKPKLGAKVTEEEMLKAPELTPETFKEPPTDGTIFKYPLKGEGGSMVMSYLRYNPRTKKWRKVEQGDIEKPKQPQVHPDYYMRGAVGPPGAM